MVQMENKPDAIESGQSSAELFGSKKGKKRRANRKEKISSEKNLISEPILKPENLIEKPEENKDNEKEPAGEISPNIKNPEQYGVNNGSSVEEQVIEGQVIEENKPEKPADDKPEKKKHDRG